MEKNSWRKPSLLCYVLQNELTDEAKEFRNSMKVVKHGHQLTKDAFCRYERMVDLGCKDSASFARARENVYGSLEILNSSFLVADNILADFDRAMEDSLDHQKKKFHIHQIKTVLSAGEKEKKHMMDEDMALLNFLFRENKRRLRELYGECEVKTQKTEGMNCAGGAVSADVSSFSGSHS